MAKGYWVSVYREISDPDKLAAYAKLALPAIQKYGGRPLARGGRTTGFEDGSDNRVVIMEFESYEQAMTAHDSPEYSEALDALRGGAVRDFRVTEGVD